MVMMELNLKLRSCEPRIQRGVEVENAEQRLRSRRSGLERRMWQEAEEEKEEEEEEGEEDTASIRGR